MRRSPFIALLAVLLLAAGTGACTADPEPSPSATPSASASPPPLRPGASSFDLIRAAVAAGTLPVEQAVLYRAYAAYDVSRLPAQYRGDPANGDEGDFQEAVVAAWPGLSPGARAELLPWTLPPYVAGSAWDQPGAASAPAATPTGAPFCGTADWTISQRWNSALVAGTIRVWWRSGSTDSKEVADAVVAQAGGALSGASAVLDGLRVPGDEGSPCGGGDTAFDIAVTGDLNASAEIHRRNPETCPGPSYMKVSNSLEGGEVLRGILVHEFAHAVYNGVSGNCITDADRWFIEGTATWVMQAVVPAYRPAFGQSFLDRLDQPLNMPVASTIDDIAGGSRAYGTWLFFFDVVRRHEPRSDSTLIGSMYRNTAHNGVLPAVALALAPSGTAPDRKGLGEDWKQFASQAWNRDGIGDWDAWGITEKAALSAPDSAGEPRGGEDPTKIDLAGRHHRVYELADTRTRSLAPLSARYYAFDLAGSKDVRWVRLRNPYPAGGRGAVWALIQRGSQWTTEDWTHRETMDLCQDRDEEKADRLVLVFSNRDAVASAAGTPELVARDTCDRNFAITGTHRWTHNAPKNLVPWDTDGDMSFTGDMRCALPDEPPWEGDWTCTGRVVVNGGGTMYAYRIGTSTNPPDCQEPYVVLDLPMRFDGRVPAGPLEKVALKRDPAGIPRDYKCHTSANATPGLAIDQVYLGAALPLPDVGEELTRIMPALDPAFGVPNGEVMVHIEDKVK